MEWKGNFDSVIDGKRLLIFCSTYIKRDVKDNVYIYIYSMSENFVVDAI